MWPGLILALAWAVPCLWLADQLTPPINHDVALLLMAAERWLDGERLYVDVIDVNPPLIVWLSALAPLAERWLGLLPATTWFSGLAVATAATSAIAARRLLLRAAGDGGRGFAETAAVAGFAILSCLPGQDFGQREHLMLCAALPYLALAAARDAGARVGRACALAVAVAAALAFCLKPHFALVPLAVEGLLLARGGRRRLADPVPWTMAATAAAYAVAVLALAPAYLDIALPLAMELYAPARRGWWPVVTTSDLAVALPLWAVAAAAAFAASRQAVARLTAAAAAAAALAAIVQGTGWSYHVLPASALSLWTIALVVAERAANASHCPQRDIGRRAIAAAACAGALWLLPVNLMWPFTRALPAAADPSAQIADLMTQYARNGRAMVLSMDVWPYYPAFNYAHARGAMHFFTLWPLQGAYRQCPPLRAPQQMTAQERFVFDSVARDFAWRAPSLLFVQTDFKLARCGEKAFNFLSYFRQDPAFDRVFQGYAPLTKIGAIIVYGRL